MTCAAFPSMDSSPAPPAPTPTSSHPKASAWHSSTPRSTTGCSRRYSPPTNHRLHFHSGAPSTSSIKRWTPSFITHSYAVLPEKTCHIITGVGSPGALGQNAGSADRPDGGLVVLDLPVAAGKAQARLVDEPGRRVLNRADLQPEALDALAQPGQALVLPALLA